MLLWIRTHFRVCFSPTFLALSNLLLCFTMLPPLVSVCLSHAAHDEWLKTKNERGRTMRRSVLADSSDLGIYAKSPSSDINPGYFMCTARDSLKGTEIPCAQLNTPMRTQQKTQDTCKFTNTVFFSSFLMYISLL